MMRHKVKTRDGRIILQDMATYPLAPVEPMPLTRPDRSPGFPARMPQETPGQRTVTHTVTTSRTVTETRTETITERIEPAALPGYEPPYILVRGYDNGGPRWRRADGSAMSPAEIAEAQARIRSGRAEVYDIGYVDGGKQL